MAAVVTATGSIANACTPPPRRPVIGYIPYWDQTNGFDDARQNLAVFDQISPMWYSLDEQARVVPADDTYTHIDPAQVRFLQSRGVRVIPTLVDLRNGTWQPGLVSPMLADPAHRQRHITSIVDTVMTEGYDGIDVDYEDLRSVDRDPYTAFITDLAAELHSQGKLLTLTVYAKQAEPGPNEHNVAQNYPALGAACDQLRVMAYDFHSSGSPPGPVAPADWVRQSLAWAVSVVPAPKLYLGLALFGYDWVADGEGAPVTYQEAIRTATTQGAQVDRDKDGSLHFTYTDSNTASHQVWFEDAQSTRTKLAIAEQLNLGGTFFWRLGGEDPATWRLLSSRPSAKGF